MIPKIIHYCWFGRKPLPESAIKCINSWKKYLPDYEIKQWNEDNFDVHMLSYTHDAYEAKKFAFVSDYARFWILYYYGGLYFDTDVEVIRMMDDIIEAGPFMGSELQDGTVNPGLGLAAEAKMPLYKEILDNFTQMNFWDNSGMRSNYSMIPMVTGLLRKAGLGNASKIQNVRGVMIYPVDYFNPLDSLTGKLRKTNNTHTIHWYVGSWMPAKPGWMKTLRHLYHRIIFFFIKKIS